MVVLWNIEQGTGVGCEEPLMTIAEEEIWTQFAQVQRNVSNAMCPVNNTYPESLLFCKLGSTAAGTEIGLQVRKQ